MHNILSTMQGAEGHGELCCSYDSSRSSSNCPMIWPAFFVHCLACLVTAYVGNIHSIQPSRHMRVSSWVRPSLLHGRKFGSPGHHLNVGSSYGLLRTISAGQQTDLHAVGCPARNAVHFVIKMKKPSTISWLVASLLGNFGFFC